MKIKKVFIEASSITEDNISGIGHATVEIVRFMELNPNYGKDFELILLAGYDKVHKLEQWHFKKTKLKKIPCPQRVLNLLWKFNLLPPLDIIIGKGVYIFPNYKNWPLIFSKSITYIHDLGYLVYPQYVSPKNQKFLVRNMKKWIKRTTILATDSESAKDDIMKFYKINASKIRVIYHGVDTKFFSHKSKAEVDRVKAKYNIIGNFLFYLGNIEPRKNLVNLIKAYSNLPQLLRDDYSLVLVGGNGWLNQEILDSIEEYKQKGFNIIKPDNKVPDEDLPGLYSAASILVHPAFYEGFGLSIVQAMACGLPVIVGNNSSMAEIVKDNGLKVDPNNINDISSAIKKLLTNKELSEKYSTIGRLRAKEFSWSNSADKLVSLIGEI